MTLKMTIVVLFCLVLLGCSNKEELATKQQQLQTDLDNAIIASQRFSSDLEFDQAIEVLSSMDDRVPVTNPLVDDLDTAKNAVYKARSKWQIAKSKGWIVFEGKMTDPVEKSRVLKERQDKKNAEIRAEKKRKAEREAASRRRIEDARRKKVAEKKRQAARRQKEYEATYGVIELKVLRVWQSSEGYSRVAVQFTNKSKHNLKMLAVDIDLYSSGNKYLCQETATLANLARGASKVEELIVRADVDDINSYKASISSFVDSGGIFSTNKYMIKIIK